jgi:hypothetical protein
MAGLIAARCCLDPNELFLTFQELDLTASFAFLVDGISGRDIFLSERIRECLVALIAGKCD